MLLIRGIDPIIEEAYNRTTPIIKQSMRKSPSVERKRLGEGIQLNSSSTGQSSVLPTPEEEKMVWKLSEYEADDDGQVVTEVGGYELPGFSVGPNNTIIGPDGRVLWGTRVGEKSKIEIIHEAKMTEEHMERKIQQRPLPSYLSKVM